MARRLGWWSVLLVAALVLGVTNAGGRSLAITTVTVEVIGKGTVTSAPTGVKCGNGKKTCYIAFSSAGTITLTADPADNWSFDHWDDNSPVPDCDAAVTTTCVVTLDGNDHLLTANFSGPPTSTSTLSVTHTGAGNVKGGGINCGSAGTACTWTVLTGSTLTVRETPNADNVFSGWGGACSGTDVACTVEMSGNQTVSATWSSSSDTSLLTVTVSGSGTVKGGGINCPGPSTCTAAEPANSTVTLTATPSDGYILTGWTEDCAGTGTTCTVTMDADRDVTATFVPSNTLTVTVNGNGNVSGGNGAINCGNGGTVCSANLAVNSTITLTATSSTGASFAGWSGACGGTATTCTVLMSSAKSVTATFSGGVGATFPLTVSVSGSGTVTGGGINCGNGASTCSANAPANTTVTLTATPASGATFTGWGGACSGTTTTCFVSMTSANTVSATFSAGTPPFTLSVSVSGSGSVSGGGISCGNGATTCSANVTANSSVTLTATPASGATFTGWGGACSGSAKTCTVTMNAAKTVSARFSGGAAETLTLNVLGRGTVSSSGGKCAGSGPKKTCVQHFAAGKSVVLTAAPQPGAKFVGWSDACTGTKTTCTVVLTAAKTVTAAFSGAQTAATAVLTVLGPPVVRRAGAGFQVTLRFNTRQSGLAHVHALRAGRTETALSLQVAAGPATIGPFPVSKSGFYTFEITLGAHAIHWRTCLGLCGAAAPGPAFVLTREPPTVTRTGDVWSVTLHLRANVISDARVRAYRGTTLLVDQHFLAPTGEIIVGPFLLGRGSYTLRVTANDAYGRVQTLTWFVSLAR